MRISEAWLREYVNPPLGVRQLAEQLTMAGLEVDSLQPVAADFRGVVVAEVLSVSQHPDAERLRVCQVAIGGGQRAQIVCGASNARAGLKAAAALPGALLPGGVHIKRATLRGVDSLGMLCSAKELGLAADAQGLLELPADAPVGTDIRAYLMLDDTLIEVDLTPNRADCLSVEGLAREVAALNGLPLALAATWPVAMAHQRTQAVRVLATAACPSYLGRLITGIDNRAPTPLWMQERLRRSGLRSLGPVVDVTNYVLLELGQPLHAFDADRLQGEIHVRYARQGEALLLLNGQTVSLDHDTLVIADQRQVLALAGVMGGHDCAVGDGTTSVFLECAFFSPQAMAGKARRHGLHTDASHRFERGVDHTLQPRALERASALILAIAGGHAGPVTRLTEPAALPERRPVPLRRRRIRQLLGVELADQQVAESLKRLDMAVVETGDGWQVTPPARRFDIAIEADLIEEVARVYGYNRLPASRPSLRGQLAKAPEQLLDIGRLQDLLVGLGYQEAITYSFVDEGIQRLLAPGDPCVRLANPISSELAVMRTSLWCGLLKAAVHNVNRQQQRVRLFEAGARFVNQGGQTAQQHMLAGLALGGVFPEQWGQPSRLADFFDIKADVQALLALTGQPALFSKASHPALHPGQSAQVLSAEGEGMGWMGMLHPGIEKQLGFACPVFLFELDQSLLLRKRKPAFKPLSNQPRVRRDLALLVAEAISADDIVATVRGAGGPSLQEVNIFDVYRGQGVAPGHKSVALGLVLQSQAQTLADTEIETIVNNVLAALAAKLNAQLRV